MPTEKNKIDKDKKIPYEKPKLTRINLVAEEVMGSGCKTSPLDGSGLGGQGCTTGICSITPGS